MSALGHHLMLRLRDGRVVAPTVAARRLLARTVLGLGAGANVRLLAFRAADTHVHLLAACGAPQATELARRVEIALTLALRPGVGFAHAHVRPIEGQAHLRNALRYVLRQEQHHGTDLDPRHEASNLPDLLGLRLVGAYTAQNVRTLLPRMRRDALLECLDPSDGGLARLLAAPELPPAEHLAPGLPEAAAAATALPDLDGRSTEVVAARHAAVHAVGVSAKLTSIADALSVTCRTVSRLRSEPAPPRLVRAVALQLWWRAGAGAAPT